jgi:nucleoid-associated protein YgaU
MEDGKSLTQGRKQVMTRETKIGLLLGMGVILLIGIIISDQLAPQSPPADFTRFGAEAQRSIDASDAAPTTGYTVTPGSPGYPATTGTPGIATPGQPAETSTVIEPPSNFFIPSDRQPVPAPQRQADSTPTGSPNLPLTDYAAYNVDETSSVSRSQTADDVPTLRVGQQRDTELPHTMVAARTPATGSANLTTAPRGRGSVILHTVLKGETLTKIALRYYGNGDYWRTIAQANRGKVTLDGQVQIGAVLNIPKRDDAVLVGDFVPNGSERLIRVDTPSTNRAGKTITVQGGDTLSELASKHLGSATRWQELLDANSDKLDGPQSLQVGMKLRLPGSTTSTQARANTSDRSSKASHTGKTYTVRPGDNLTEIAEKTLGDGDRWRDVFQANRDKLKSADRLVVGQKLRIPS